FIPQSIEAFESTTPIATLGRERLLRLTPHIRPSLELYERLKKKRMMVATPRMRPNGLSPISRHPAP
ncbi:MAG: hypothetical protein KGQ41_09875, partial [Alphaproteobacteria bacterium]|nr:hypothetical protein [Alphaproteobacteria bacterium]